MNSVRDIQLPLSEGDSGAGIRDLQGLLDLAGFSVESSETGAFGPSTLTAVVGFQRARGLEPDGLVGEATWTALIEARHRLGDRLLCLRTPMMRGDDVAELQILLGSLGFDTDKVDGILGPGTQSAVGDFQRSVGLVADEVCGPDTALALRRIRSRGGETSVAFVREREELARTEHTFASLTVCCVHDGSFTAVANAVHERVESLGRGCYIVVTGDRSEAAAQVNELDPDVCLGFRTGPSPELRVAYFGSARYVSAAGRRLASAIAREIPRLRGFAGVRVEPMQLPLLRETRCVAVDITMGDSRPRDDELLAVVNGLQRSLESWIG